MNLATLRSRIDRLLERRGDTNDPPSTIVVLPYNGRGPNSDVRPFPRVSRVGQAAIIVCDPATGQPSSADIARLLAGGMGQA